MNRYFKVIFSIILINLAVIAIAQQPQAKITQQPPPVQAYQLSYIPTNVLAFDAEAKEYNAKPGEVDIPFTFYVTNVSSEEVIINSVHTSCGCTVAELPSLPWKMAPGDRGEIKVKMDVRGKVGAITKTININSTRGIKILAVTARVPMPDMMSTTQQERERNQLIARANRQAVFQGDCARCHSAPGVGKMGEDLYKAVCGVCHEAQHRASMVPDLKTLGRPNTREYWADIIMHGKKDTLMPGFSKIHNGPFTDEQIFSLVEYMVGPFQRSIRSTSAAGK